MQFKMQFIITILAVAALAVATLAAPVLPQTTVVTTVTLRVTVTVTRTVTVYEPSFPTPTHFTKGGKVFTATAEQWVTVESWPQKCPISYNHALPTVLPIGHKEPWNNETAPVVGNHSPGTTEGEPVSRPGHLGTTTNQAHPFGTNFFGTNVFGTNPTVPCSHCHGKNSETANSPSLPSNGAASSGAHGTLCAVAAAALFFL